MKAVRRLVAFEAAAFACAALTHFGILIGGYEHRRAGIAESVIGSVLLAGWILILARPAAGRTIGIAVQSCALLGTLVGMFTIAIGIGPRTLPDIAFHMLIVGVLVWGIAAATRAAAIQPI
jgi:hypothetical protein